MRIVDFGRVRTWANSGGWSSDYVLNAFHHLLVLRHRGYVVRVVYLISIPLAQNKGL
jgi:hypothetical protein